MLKFYFIENKAPYKKLYIFFTETPCAFRRKQKSRTKSRDRATYRAFIGRDTTRDTREIFLVPGKTENKNNRNKCFLRSYRFLLKIICYLVQILLLNDKTFIKMFVTTGSKYQIRGIFQSFLEHSRLIRHISFNDFGHETSRLLN